ncbi:hypothetical protein B0H10DRAFT_2137377, partial [Mycena sp. CBHHK59/15]
MATSLRCGDDMSEVESLVSVCRSRPSALLFTSFPSQLVHGRVMSRRLRIRLRCAPSHPHPQFGFCYAGHTPVPTTANLSAHGWSAMANGAIACRLTVVRSPHRKKDDRGLSLPSLNASNLTLVSGGWQAEIPVAHTSRLPASRAMAAIAQSGGLRAVDLVRLGRVCVQVGITFSLIHHHPVHACSSRNARPASLIKNMTRVSHWHPARKGR